MKQNTHPCQSHQDGGDAAYFYCLAVGGADGLLAFPMSSNAVGPSNEKTNIDPYFLQTGSNRTFRPANSNTNNSIQDTVEEGVTWRGGRATHAENKTRAGRDPLVRLPKRHYFFRPLQKKKKIPPPHGLDGRGENGFVSQKEMSGKGADCARP